MLIEHANFLLGGLLKLRTQFNCLNEIIFVNFKKNVLFLFLPVKKFYIFVRFLNPVGSSSSAARGQIAANLDESGRVLGPHS